MSTSCSSLLLSPTTKQQQQQPSIAGSEADLFNKYTLHDSPRSASALAHNFKTPSSVSKWPRAVLAPLRLLPAPIRSSRVPAASAAGDLSPSAPPRLLAATGSPFTSTSPVTETNHTTSCDLLNTTDHSANDVEQLLHLLLAPSLSNNDTNTRTRILTALCSLLHAPSTSVEAVQKFVAVGGVETILNILNSTAQCSHAHPLPPAVAVVEERALLSHAHPLPPAVAVVEERALLLLQLSTSSSQDACTAALQHSASNITAALGRKLLRISETCTASTIAVLTSLCRHCDSNAATLFRKAVSKTAIPSKLVVVLQVASKDSTKRRAARLLRLLGEEQEQEQQDTSDAHYKS